MFNARRRGRKTEHNFEKKNKEQTIKEQGHHFV